jgi:hypothetical protein
MRLGELVNILHNIMHYLSFVTTPSRPCQECVQADRVVCRSQTQIILIGILIHFV